MESFRSFDGARIAFHDEGHGPAVVLLHGYGLNALTAYGDFEHSRALIERNLAMVKEAFGVAPPMPNPPAEGRAGLIARLREKGARVIAPDCAGSGRRTSRTKRPPTRVRRWPATSSLSSATSASTPPTCSAFRWAR